MLAAHNFLGIEIAGWLKGYAEGPLGIGALLCIAALMVWCLRNRSGPPT
jgi:hypothetical protein